MSDTATLSKADRAAAAVAERRAKVLAAGIEEAKANGYQWITREAVARRAGVADGSVNHAFGRMVELKRAVLRAAVEQGIPEIVAQGLADGHPIAKGAPPDLKERALATISH
jgi:AcrR family transcriptional regulator